jgi:hypothetical protein
MLLQDPRLDFYITKGRRVQALGHAGCEPGFGSDINQDLHDSFGVIAEHFASSVRRMPLSALSLLTIASCCEPLILAHAERTP